MAFGIFPSLTGNEVLQVTGVQANGMPSGQSGQCTTGQIAALAATEGAPFIVTPITTVGNGVLTAAGLIGGEIVRTGPVANYSDTTDTAAAMAALSLVGSSFSILIKNATAFTQTIVAGAGVTLPMTVIIPAFSVSNYIATINSATTATWVHIDTTQISVGANTTAPSIAVISTVGAGIITAASFVGGLIARTGAQSGTPFTDTTDTAANIVAASANLANKVGTSMLVEYANNTNAVVTIAGGTGVTVSGITVLPAGMVAQYLLTYTATNTVTMVGVGSTFISQLPVGQFVTGTTATTFVAGQLTGAAYTVYTNTQATPGSIATRTATQMIADIPNAYVGQTWVLRVVNGQGTGTLTMTAGTGVTLTGAATVAINSTRDFVCTITNIGTPAITFQNIGTGTFS